ncbi:MAG: CubicO group peptidase (beta-lactamase class C family) [Lysobacterales bacterium]|jgi:CubicO group peptidase (beta-lactamase class C family)
MTLNSDRPWPTFGWQSACADSKGVKTTPLDQLDNEISTGLHGYIDGVRVFRHGYLIYEREYECDFEKAAAGRGVDGGQYNYHDVDWHPWYRRGDLHSFQSISKSVTSALIGIAIHSGEIPGIEIPIMSWFSNRVSANPDPRRSQITLEQLLTMTAGIKWDEESTEYTDPENSAAAMESSPDWVQYVIDQAINTQPGEVFVYSSGVTILLSAILREATGQNAQDYAKEHLFGPLGIEPFFWKKTAEGLTDTEGGLYLKPTDMAKIGYLYANDGVWNGRRILPEGWVKASMQPAIEAGDWEGVRYGYQWWLLPYDGGESNFACVGLGYGGQGLFILPEYDLVSVITGWNIYGDPQLSAEYALKIILESVQ